MSFDNAMMIEAWFLIGPTALLETVHTYAHTHTHTTGTHAHMRPKETTSSFVISWLPGS